MCLLGALLDQPWDNRGPWGVKRAGQPDEIEGCE